MKVLTFEERSQFMQCRVCRILEPTFNENAVIWLKRKVLCYIVHNNSFMERSAYPGQVLDEDHACRARMLPVEPIGDILVFIDRVEDPVGVVLHRSRENDNFIHFGHLTEEFFATGPDSEAPLTVHFVVVDERLVQVQHERVAGWVSRLGKIRRLHDRQRFVATDGCSTDAVERWQHLLRRQFQIFYRLGRTNDSLSDLVNFNGFHLLYHARYCLIERLQGLRLNQLLILKHTLVAEGDQFLG